MQKKLGLFRACLGLVLVLLLASCTTFKMENVAYGTINGEVLGTFSTKVKVHEFLGDSGGMNFVNITSTAMDKKIQDAIDYEIKKLGGSAAINVKIEQKASALDMFLNWITCDIYAPATVTVTGTVIR